MKFIPVSADNGEEVSISLVNKHTGLVSHVKLDSRSTRCSAGSDTLFILLLSILLVMILLLLGFTACHYFLRSKQRKYRTEIEPIKPLV